MFLILLSNIKHLTSCAIRSFFEPIHFYMSSAQYMANEVILSFFCRLFKANPDTRSNLLKHFKIISVDKKMSQKYKKQEFLIRKIDC